MSDDRAVTIANALQALADLDEDFAEQRKDYQARRETLVKEVNRMRRDILSGQMTLGEEKPLEIKGASA